MIATAPLTDNEIWTPIPPGEIDPIAGSIPALGANSFTGYGNASSQLAFHYSKTSFTVGRLLQ